KRISFAMLANNNARVIHIARIFKDETCDTNAYLAITTDDSSVNPKAKIDLTHFIVQPNRDIKVEKMTDGNYVTSCGDQFIYHLPPELAGYRTAQNYVKNIGAYAEQAMILAKKVFLMSAEL